MWYHHGDIIRQDYAASNTGLRVSFFRGILIDLHAGSTQNKDNMC